MRIGGPKYYIELGRIIISNARQSARIQFTRLFSQNEVHRDDLILHTATHVKIYG